MEDKKSSFFNSPCIQRNIPIKRLGLSRKRKMCGSEISSTAKVQKKIGEEKILSSSAGADKADQEDTLTSPEYESEVESLKKIIFAKKEKLKTLKKNNDTIVCLESLTEKWKNGCKNAYLHMKLLLNEKHPENVSSKDIVKQLGIRQTMIENFENDSDISLSDCSQ